MNIIIHSQSISKTFKKRVYFLNSLVWFYTIVYNTNINLRISWNFVGKSTARTINPICWHLEIKIEHAFILLYGTFALW